MTRNTNFDDVRVGTVVGFERPYPPVLLAGEEYTVIAFTAAERPVLDCFLYAEAITRELWDECGGYISQPDEAPQAPFEPSEDFKRGMAFERECIVRKLKTEVDEFDRDHGSVCPETGVTEFGNPASEDWSNDRHELIEAIETRDSDDAYRAVVEKAFEYGRKSRSPALDEAAIRDKALEDAALLIEGKAIGFREDGTYLYPRKGGDTNGVQYAFAIRQMKGATEQPPARTDTDRLEWLERSFVLMALIKGPPPVPLDKTIDEVFTQTGGIPFRDAIDAAMNREARG